MAKKKEEKPLQVDVKFTDKQAEAWYKLTDSTTTEILFGGGAGSGKSYLGCLFVLYQCINYPGVKYLLGRSKLTDLKKTTLATLFDIISSWGIKPELYTYNQQDNFIRFWNGSEIILKDLATYPTDPNFDSLGSLEITGAFIDEVGMISEKAKNVVASRIRYKLEQYGLIPKLFMSCNPTKGWVYNDFYKPYKNGVLPGYKSFIPALVKDNPYISKFYQQQLERLDEQSRQRLLFGSWEFEDNYCLISYDKILNLFDVEPQKDVQHQVEEEYYLTVDPARLGKDKAVLMVWRNFTVVEILDYDKSTMDFLVNKVKDLQQKYNISNRNVITDSDGVGGSIPDFIKGSIAFQNNSKALSQENYQNLKTQCYYKLSEMVNTQKIKIGCFTLKQKENIIQELEQVKRSKVDSDTKLSIVGKDEIKASIGRSPDYSDCLMLRAWYELKQNTKITGEYFIKVR